MSEVGNDDHLGDITALLAADCTFVEAAERALDIGTAHLGVEHGHFTRIVPHLDHWEVIASTDGTDGPAPIGTVADLQTMVCRRSVEADATRAFDGDELDESLDATGWGDTNWNCYITTPVDIDGELYGTLCFADTGTDANSFDRREQQLTECLAEVLSTKRTAHEQQRTLANRNRLIGILSRILRHNFRNDMSVIRGRINHLIDRLDETEAEADVLEATIEEIISLTEKSRELRRIAERDPTYVEQSVDDLVGNAVARVREAHPEATIAIDAPDGVALLASPTVETAVHELVENAVKHAPNSRCTVTVGESPDEVRLTVADDGPGLPAQEQRAMEGRNEEALSHNQGVGLWIVRWVGSSHDGSIELDVSETGTTITMVLPRVTANDQLIAA